jgi:SAM-dependent methyltransferase
VGRAAERWAEELAAWAIPEEILASVPESPWGFPPALFGPPAAGESSDTPSLRRAREALGHGGSVIDVGVGGGAASLPLVPAAEHIVGVDESRGMLDAFAARAEELGVGHLEVQGRWPDVTDSVPVADVVVCNNVFYNVADLVPFVSALGAHARRRVVVELTDTHPLVTQNPLWRHFHPGVPRPEGPTAEDAAAVLAEAGVDVRVERAQRPARATGDRQEWVRFVRRRLCVPEAREAEVDARLQEPDEVIPRNVVTLWWEGRA